MCLDITCLCFEKGRGKNHYRGNNWWAKGGGRHSGGSINSAKKTAFTRKEKRVFGGE